MSDRERLTEFFVPFTHNYVEALQIASYVLRRSSELRAILTEPEPEPEPRP